MKIILLKKTLKNLLLGKLKKNINDKTNKNIVLVIGESVRKDLMHSYGFPIKNTPFIDSSKNIKFTNYKSVGSHSVQSLMHTIALSDNLKDYQINNSVVSLEKKLEIKHIGRQIKVLLEFMTL